MINIAFKHKFTMIVTLHAHLVMTPFCGTLVVRFTACQTCNDNECQEFTTCNEVSLIVKQAPILLRNYLDFLGIP